MVDIDAKENKIIVGTKDDLLINKIYLKDVNLLGQSNEYNENLFIKVRSTGKLIKAKTKFNSNNNEAVVDLLENEVGISPGQACVFYSKNILGDKVLGGGWIARTLNNYLST